MATTYVSNKAELLAALSSAKGGDEILLKSGDYGSVEIENKDFSSFVTIKSADGKMGATFDSLDIVGSSNIRVDSVHVDSPSNGGRSVVAISKSQNIDFINSEVNGKVDNVYPIAGPSFGIYVSDSSSGIRVENNYIHDIQNGAGFFGTRNLTVVENKIENIGADGLKFASVKSALIENNTGPRYVYPADGAHSDFMQFQGDPSSDIVIRGNVFMPVNQLTTQGIFMGGKGGHSDILIEQNIIYTAMANGVYVKGEDILIRYNTLINHLDDEQSTTRINSSGAKVENNISTRKVGGESGSNIDIQHTNKNGDYYYTDLFAGLKGSGAITIEDLAPVAGSAAETKGAYLRIAELLGEDAPAEPEPPVVETPVEVEEEPAPVEPEPVVVEEPEETPAEQEETEEPTKPTDGVVGAVYTFDEARNFSHVTDVIELAPSANQNLAAATIALTFNADSVDGTHGLVSKDAYQFSGGGNHFTSYIREGVLYARFQDGENSKVFTVKDIKANTDYDLQVSFGNGEVAVWLNDKIVGAEQFDASWVNNNEYLQIGANGWSSQTGQSGFVHVFDGTVSDFVILEGFRTPEEVTEIFDDTIEVITQPPSDPDPVEPPSVDPAPHTGSDAEIVFSMMDEMEFSRSSRDIVNLEHDDALEISEGSIALTFSADNAGRFGGLISKDASHYDGGGNHFSAWIKDDKLNVRFQDEDGDAKFEVGKIKDGQEYELLAYFTDNEVGLYLDGKLIGSQEMSFSLEGNGEYLQVGGLGWSSKTGEDDVTKAFDGTISDVIIFDEAITPDEFDGMM